jgi:hypothetical protein
VRFNAPDLDVMEKFATTFDLQRAVRGERTLYKRGTDEEVYTHVTHVADLDDLMRGNTLLAGAGHTHQWGIGRHILGSQIYDYWLDPWGHMVEHWTDGDLFDDTTPPNIASLTDLIGSQWGPTHVGPPM